MIAKIAFITALGFAYSAHATQQDPTPTDSQAPESPVAYEAIMSGDLAAAEKTLGSAPAEVPKDPFKLLNLAYVMHEQGREAEAIAVYKQILELDENPYAELASGKPSRVKAIARHALALIEGEGK